MIWTPFCSRPARAICLTMKANAKTLNVEAQAPTEIKMQRIKLVKPCSRVYCKSSGFRNKKFSSETPIILVALEKGF
jgi:hypothetical protein